MFSAKYFGVFDMKSNFYATGKEVSGRKVKKAKSKK